MKWCEVEEVTWYWGGVLGVFRSGLLRVFGLALTCCDVGAVTWF